jgi:NO-binding membrane sensor protein with MHYT domain
MTLFEYLTIAFSLIFSFSAMRLLSGLPYAIRPEARYWVHLAFILIHLGGTAFNFWNYWKFHDADWTLPKFLVALGPPAAVYFIACSLVPENPSAVTSWRNHYYSVRQSFFLGLIVWALAVTAMVTFVTGLPWLHPLRVGQAILLLYGAVGMLVNKPRIHAALAIGAVIGLAVTASTVYLQPDSLPR